MKKVTAIIAALALTAGFMLVGCKSRQERRMNNAEVVAQHNAEVVFSEMWIDDNTWQCLGIGQCNDQATGPAQRYNQAKSAAQLQAQARAQEFFTEAYIESTSGAVDGVSIGQAVRSRVEGFARGGYVYREKWDSDNCVVELIWRVERDHLKELYLKREFYESTLEH